MNGFKTKKIKTELNLGEILKQARLKKEISIGDAERKTKIKMIYLEALEKNDFTILPSNTYAKAYVRSYARFLKLPEAEILSRYHFEGEYQTKQIRSEFSPKSNLRAPIFVLTPAKLTSFIIGVVIAVFAGYLWYQVSGFAAAPMIELKSPKDSKVEIEAETIEIRGSTDPGSTLYINQQPIGIDREGVFTATIHLKSGANIIEIMSKNKLGKESKRLITVVASPKSYQSVEMVESFQGLKLVIETAPNSAWVTIDCDGKKQFRGVMLAKTRQEFYAQNEVFVSTANAGSVHLFLNGKDLGILGREGMSKNIRLNKDNLI